ncbi:MAG: Gfo/Idh/MocA family oxidoreductase [Deltaproteobacteria bacterium]|nr:Gfo/Idh/MocA family oxidoreductase [Deltaproteobacteria bacterium]
MIRIGVIGYGYWGPNIVRNFSLAEGAEVTIISDASMRALQRVGTDHPHIKTTRFDTEVLFSTDLDAVAIVTPVSTHYELAKKALTNGKHVFIEKPFTASTAQAEELLNLAEQKNLKIMVDHTFLFTGAVRKIKQLVEDEVLGELYYFDSTRINLGLLQSDVNVVWDLVPHDLSIMDYLIKQEPLALSATGMAHINGMEDVAYITIYFSGNLIAHFNVNWLSPVKIRTTLIGGQKKMLVWNDLEADEKIRVYDRGVEINSKEQSYHARVNYRSGDIWVPRLVQVEALKAEAEYFVNCINQDLTPINDGRAGYRVVRILEAIVTSLDNRGAITYLS